MGRLGRSGPAGEVNSLPFVEAQSVRPGMVMFDEHGGYDVVERVERIPLDRTCYDLDVAGTHNFVAEGLVTHNSIYGFRGADIRNILEFEDTYPEAHVVRLEQNYRSTQTILSAANAVVANNRGRKVKSLWTEIGEGDTIKIRELADEHAEARFVVAEVERLVDEGVSRAELAVFYRTNAQSRVLEDMLVRAQIGYQVIGGTKFYERAEVKDAIAYLIFLINPADGGAFTRIANSPKRGIGQTSLSRVLGPRGHDGHHAVGGGRAPRPGAAARDGGAEGARAVHVDDGAAARARRGRRAGRRRAGGAAAGDGYLDALEAERTIEAQGRIENLQELVQVAREYDATAAAETRGVAEFLQQIALLSDADTRRDDEGLVTLDDAPQRQGPRVPDRLHHRLRGRRVPPLAGARRGRRGGGAPAGLRRHHPRHARPLHHLRPPPQRVRRRSGGFALRSRFVDEIPRELTDQPDRNAVGLGRPAGAGRVASWATAAAASADGSGTARAGGRRRRATSSASATTSSTPRSARAS